MLSTRTTFAGAAAKYSMIFGRERSSCVESASVVERLEYERGVYFGL